MVDRISLRQRQLQRQRLEQRIQGLLEIAQQSNIPSDDFLRMTGVKGPVTYRTMVVDPYNASRRRVSGDLRREDIIVEEREDWRSALEEIPKTILDGVYLNWRQSGTNGLHVAAQLRAKNPDMLVGVYVPEESPMRHTDLLNLLKTKEYANLDSVEIHYTGGVPPQLSLEKISRIGGEARSMLELTSERPPDALVQSLFKLFKAARLKEKIPCVTKFGGSTLKYNKYGGINWLLNEYVPFVRKNPQFAHILTVGAGDIGYTIKDMWNPNDGILEHELGQRLPEAAAKRALDTNIEFLYHFLEPYAHLIEPDSREGPRMITDDYFDGTFVLMGYPPWPFRRRLGISLSASDECTKAICQMFGATHALFLKNTPGIFLYDPNREDAPAYNPQLKALTAIEMANGKVQIDNRLRKMSRKGTDERDEHLDETSALMFMHTYGHPETVVIGNPSIPKLLDRVCITADYDSDPMISRIVLDRDQPMRPPYRRRDIESPY